MQGQGNFDVSLTKGKSMNSIQSLGKNYSQGLYRGRYIAYWLLCTKFLASQIRYVCYDEYIIFVLRLMVVFYHSCCGLTCKDIFGNHWMVRLSYLLQQQGNFDVSLTEGKSINRVSLVKKLQQPWMQPKVLGSSGYVAYCPLCVDLLALIPIFY